MAAVVAAVRRLLGWGDGSVQHSPGGEPLVKVLPSRQVRSYPRTAHVEPRLGPGGVPFASNHVRTARYTVLTFLPKQLWQQFSKLANLYFLVIGLLQQIPGISPTGQFTTIGPLILFVALAMAREAYDDWLRHKQDDVENKSRARVWRADLEGSRGQGTWAAVEWQEIAVGDIVVLRSDEAIPADILLLRSSDERGICYVETASLDGESNLKERQAIKYTQQRITSGADAVAFDGVVHAEAPSSLLYNFDGYLDHDGSKHALTASQLLLRGAVLKNTAEVIGLVLFTGEETKMRLNATPAPTKSPTMERMTNRVVIAIFGFLLVLTIIFSSLAVAWDNAHLPLPYLGGSDAGPSWISQFGTFLILFNTLIPISLYVTMEFVKLVQAKLIEYDAEMYHAPTGTFAGARTSSLNEELGQVQYVFSDKTGTLTENLMLFHSCSVGGRAYVHHTGSTAAATGGSPHTPSDTGLSLSAENMPLRPLPESPGAAPPSAVASPTPAASLPLASTAELARLRAERTPASEAAHAFLLAMALCHTVVPSTDESAPDAAVPQYQGSSPDETALVQGAAEMGYVFHDRRAEMVTVIVDGRPAEYEVLHVLQFTSDRKRMSVIYRMPDGRVLLLCKGADAVILERLRAGQEDAVATVQAHIDAFAKDGLRTLAYAAAELPEARFKEWEQTFLAASVALQNRQALLDAAAAEIERDLTLLGATAIEDKLQAGVAHTITALQAAGIHLWVLTGDKLETAVNVGYASALIKAQSTVITLTVPHGHGHDDDATTALKRQINQAFTTIADTSDVVLVVEGSTLAVILDKDRLVADFLGLAVHAHSVICCRVSPIQKADIVSLVRQRLGKVTLAIGDGANDISMIQAAHVGIGITGREGLQAARASDYTIAQFRFLERLLLVHGHWSYVRNAKFLLGSFYKCFAFYLTQAIFQGFAGYSGTSLYEQWTLASYNVFFALLPVIFVGIFEQDVPASALLRLPQLYKSGRESELYNLRTFARWMGQAVFHAFVIALIPIFLYGYFPGLYYNEDDGLYLLGTIAYTGVIFVVTFKIGYLEARHWTWANHLILWGTIAFWFLFQAVYSQMPRLSYVAYGLSAALWRNSKFPFTVLLVVAAALLPDCVYNYVCMAWHPSDPQLVHEMAWAAKRKGSRALLDAAYVDDEAGAPVTATVHAGRRYVTIEDD